MRFFTCGKCRKTVTKIKWSRDKEMFTATPICMECWKQNEEKERKEIENGTERDRDKG